MVTIGIVSSTDVSCGNAAFTNVIAHSLERLDGVSVQLLSLDLELTQSRDARLRRLADRHIRELAAQCSLLDAVNIQFEPGLYGLELSDAARRLDRLVASSPRSFVTLHAVRSVNHDDAGPRESVRQLLSLNPRRSVQTFMKTRAQQRQVEATETFLESIFTRDRQVIVHTLRSERRIKRLWPSARVHVHPLRMVPNAEAPARPHSQRSWWPSLPQRSTTIGLFGYYGGYKGVDTALRALDSLPDEYHLILFGRQHPQTIRVGEPVGRSVAAILNLVSELKLEERVHFAGELADDDFVEAASAVDCAWLPYLEVDQDGSGIASIAFDVSRRIVASNSSAFDELLRLIPYEGVARFDIGNHLELAQKTASGAGRVQRPETEFTLESQAQLYLECAEARVD